MSGELFDLAPLVERLLGRQSIGGDCSSMEAFLAGQRILVTGAGGSIGTALSEFLVGLHPACLVLLDHHENSLFQLRQRLMPRLGDDRSVRFILADIRDTRKMSKVLREYSPDTMFHLAAYKHVPLAEESPEEFVSINLLGTWRLLQEACNSGIRRVVYPSTDKAVNPPSIYGATKRMVEVMLQTLAAEKPDVWLTPVRLVNVVGAHGGVIEIFARQIREGRALTVTDGEMTRYWITMQEALYLLTQAAYAGKTSRPLILDLGQPVKLLEIARRAWETLGPPGEEMRVHFVGMRPGERLSEDLVDDGEYTVRTAVEGLLEVRSQVSRCFKVAQISEMLASLESLIEADATDDLRDVLFSYVHAFRSA